MQTITTIGLDIAKSVFQVHGVDNDGKVVIRRQLKRRYVLAFFEKLPPCLSKHLRPVPRHTIGHASYRHLAIPYGLCSRRPTSSLTSNGKKNEEYLKTEPSRGKKKKMYCCLWLIGGGFGYLAMSFAGLFAPQYQDTVFLISQPLLFSELAITFWLLVMGIKVRPSAVPAAP